LADFNPILNSFNAGEFSPRMKARTDLEKYASAAETIENFVIQREGGLIRRSGTRYVAPLKDMTKKSILVPFIFSTDDAYAIEFSENLIRMYTNEALLWDEEETPAIVEVVSTYTEAELFDLRFTQSGDFLYIAHQAHHPAILKRTSAYVWTLTNVPFEAGPWQEPNRDEEHKVKHGSSDGDVTVTSDTSGTFNSADDDDVPFGRMVRMSRDIAPETGSELDDKWGWGVINDYTSSMIVQVTVDPANKFRYNNSAWYSWWCLGAFSPRSSIGYPASVGLFEGRLCWAGTVAQPDTFWGSETGIFDSHLPFALRDQTTIDSHSVNYTLAAGHMNTIEWMAPMSAMVLGTRGSVHRIGGSGTDVALSPSSVLARRVTDIGSKPVAPALVGDTLCYVTKFGNEMIGLRDEGGAFSTSNLTLLAEHVLKSPATQLSYAQTPWSTVYAVRTDGELATCTLIPDQNVFGWSRQILGASNAGDAVVESVCTIPSPNEDHDQTWLIVKRTINSGTKRYVEFFEDEFDDDTDIDDAFFVDCGITYDSTPTSTIPGLDHLEGSPVQVLADGAYHPARTVASGSITLEENASKVHVGLGYVSVLETLNLNTDTQSGTMQGKMARIVRVVTRLHNTVGGEYGRDASHLSPYPNRPVEASHEAAVNPISKDVATQFRGDYDDTPTIYIKQDMPLPMTILGIMPEVALGQRS
jgi:hypothetical protein